MIGKIDYSKLIEKVGSKYRLCVVSAKRAEQLIDNQVKLRQGKKPAYESELVEELGKSPLYIALREIEEGYVRPYLPGEKEEEKAVSFARIAEGMTVDPYEAEIDVSKILDQLEAALMEMQSYLGETEEESVQANAGKSSLEVPIEESENSESIEVLQEEEIALAEKEERELEEE